MKNNIFDFVDVIGSTLILRHIVFFENSTTESRRREVKKLAVKTRKVHSDNKIAYEMDYDVWKQKRMDWEYEMFKTVFAAQNSAKWSRNGQGFKSLKNNISAANVLYDDPLIFKPDVGEISESETKKTKKGKKGSK